MTPERRPPPNRQTGSVGAEETPLRDHLRRKEPNGALPGEFVTWTRAITAVLAVLLITGSTGAQSRPNYLRGQNVSPAYEGWERDVDGNRFFLFGYMNRNWEEELDVPVGPDNHIQPGGPDAGQPTHFLPRRNRFVFRVQVPDGFDEDDEMVWTVTTAGQTEQAFATVHIDYFVDDLVQASEQGALGAGRSDPTIRANTRPVLRIEGDHSRSVRVGEPLGLVAVATDDGVPKARRRSRNPWRPPVQVTVGSATGLRVSWYLYRGDGPVTFDPPQVKVWEDTRTGANSPWSPGWSTPDTPPDGGWATEVVFTDPGTYVLRCLASDGATGTWEDVTVTVAP